VPCGGFEGAFGKGAAMFSAFDSQKEPLYSAAIFPDIASLTRQLAAQNFNQEELDAALLGASECRSDNTKAMALLIQAGADVNARRSDGNTILMEAASRLYLTNLKFLLVSGADANRKNAKGETALGLVQSRISAQNSENQLPGYVSEIIHSLKGMGAHD
jgi:ankyrin repeat protein